MAGQLIRIRVVQTGNTSTEPWEMIIQDNQDIKSYMTQGNKLLFNYQGSLYETFRMSEDQFLKLVPHLNKHQISN